MRQGRGQDDRVNRVAERAKGILVVSLEKLNAKDGIYNEDQHHDDKGIEDGYKRSGEGVDQRTKRS